jgi:anaerobic selenocysteine-containing dehydrogenase
MGSLKLTRRDFLKISGVAAIGATIAWKGRAIEKLFDPKPDPYTPNYPNDEIVYSNCFQCLGRCSLEIVRTPSGYPRFITGTIGWHINDGGVCPRGASDVFYYFSPARLRYPMIRAGNRGEGKWLAVDYDTAYDVIINGAQAKSWSKIGLNPNDLGIGDFPGLLEIKSTNPHSFAFWQGRDQLIPGETAGFFAGNFGTANSAAHGGFCSMDVYTAGVYVTGAPVWEYAGPDQERAQYFILSGLAGDHFPNWMRRIIAQIRENGGKVVTIAPERYGFYSVSDEHLFVNPAGDGALIMGMIRSLVDFHYYVYKASKGKVLNPVTLQQVSVALDPSSGNLVMQTVTPQGNVVQLSNLGNIPNSAVFPHIDEEFLRYYTNLSWLVILNPNPQEGDPLDPNDPNAGNNVGLHVRASVNNPQYSKNHPWLEAVLGNDGNVYSYVDVPWSKGVEPIITLDELPSTSSITLVSYKLKDGSTTKVPAIQVTVPSSPNGSNITLTVTTAFELLRAELMNYDPYTPYTEPAQYGVINCANVSGIPHNTIVRIANEAATVAFQKSIEEPVKWIDYLGRYHESVTGRPVSIYFMRGIAGHSNGFMTAASYYYLVLMLGAWDNPGADLYKYPYPHYFPGVAVPPHPLANTPSIDQEIASSISSSLSVPKGRTGFLKTEYIYNDGTVNVADVKVVPAGPYGYPDGPDDLVIYKTGRPLLVDRGYSWELPLSTQRSISAVAYTTYYMNKYQGIIPYKIQGMMWYITAPYWNNAYTLTDLLQKVTEKDSNGNYVIPFTIQVDLFMQETDNVVDILIPDRTFMEIYGFHSTFDRPTSLPQGPSDSLNWPALPALYPVLSAGSFFLTLLWLLRSYPKQGNNVDPIKCPHYTTQDPVTGLPLVSPIDLHDPITGQQIYNAGQPGYISSGMFILKQGILLAGYGDNFQYILKNEKDQEVPNPQQLKLYASFVPDGVSQSSVINQILSNVPSGKLFSTSTTYKIAADSRSTGVEHYFRIPVQFQPTLQSMLEKIINTYASGQMSLDDINPGVVKVGKGGASYVLPPSLRYMRNVNMLYFLGWGAYMPGGYGTIGLPYLHKIYLEYLQKFRLAAAGKWTGYNSAYYYYYLHTKNPSFLVKSVVPNDSYGKALSKNISDYFKPFGGYYPPVAWESNLTPDGIKEQEYPLTFFVRRHDRTYHSWSYNIPWLTAMMPYSPVMLSSADPYVKQFNLQSGDFVQFEAVNEPWSGGLRTMIDAIVFLDNATRPGAAWVIVSSQALPGFRGQTKDSPQVKYSVLNNWANISYMPPSRGGQLSPTVDNAFPIMHLDPITGQTSWHDSRIKILGKSTSSTVQVSANRFVYMGNDYSNQDVLSTIASQMNNQISVSNTPSTPTFAEGVDVPHLRFDVNNIQGTSIWSYVQPSSLAANNFGLGSYTVRYGFASEQR